MSFIDKFITKVAKQSEHEAKQELADIQEKETIMFGVIKTENSKLKKFLQTIDEADSFLHRLDYDAFVHSDTVDVFSRMKNLVQYFSVFGSDIKKIVEQGIEAEDDIVDKLHHIKYKHGDHDLKLFKKEQKNILHCADRIEKNAKKLMIAVRNLQEMEEENKKKEVLEKNLKETYAAMTALRRHANKIAVEFNHALKNLDEFMTSEDLRVKKIVGDHIIFFQSGFYKDRSGNVDEATKALRAAMNNINDPVFMGSHSSHGTSLSSVLNEYNKKAYGQKESAHKQLEELELKK